MGEKWIRKDSRTDKGKKKMIMIACVNCGRPVTRDHAYKLAEGGGVAHVECETPLARDRGGKTIGSASTKEDGSRTPGSGEG